MSRLTALLEERATTWANAQDVRERIDREGSNEEREASFQQHLDAVEAVDEKIDREERAETLAKVDQRSAALAGALAPQGSQAQQRDSQEAADEQLERVFRSFLRDGMGELEPEDKRILRGRAVDGKELRAAGVGTLSAGGYLVPPAFRNKVVEVMKLSGPMLQLSEVLVTETGAQLPWPTNDDTANVGAILAENTQVTEQDVTVGTANIDAYMYTSKLVRASYQLLQDRPDFDTWLAKKLGQRLGRILNQHFTTGTGTAQPDGIVTSATVGVTSTGSFASTGGISYDNLIDVTEAIDDAYNVDGTGFRFMMHQSVRKAARKLKDSQSRPLWEPSLQVGVPSSLIGYPISINNDMAPLAASSKSLLFGNIEEAYVVRIVRDVTLLRLQERYADFLQVGFLAFERADGTLQDGNAVRVFATTATA